MGNCHSVKKSDVGIDNPNVEYQIGRPIYNCNPGDDIPINYRRALALRYI